MGQLARTSTSCPGEYHGLLKQVVLAHVVIQALQYMP